MNLCELITKMIGDEQTSTSGMTVLVEIGQKTKTLYNDETHLP